jgi:DNA-binding transcriptional MerR regulator
MSEIPIPANTPRSTVTRIAYSAEETAEAIGVSERTVKNWTELGLLPVARIEGRVLYPVDMLREWIEERAAAVKRETGSYWWICENCQREHRQRPERNRCLECGKKDTLKRVSRMLDNDQATPQTLCDETV